MATSHYLGLRAGVGFVLLLAVSLAEQPRSHNAPPQHRDSIARASESGNVDPTLYVGIEACKGCHDNEGTGFAGNAHSKTLTNKRLDRRGCEACHGPGKSHADAGDPENIRRFEILSKPAIAKICSDCHDLSKGAGRTLHQQHGRGDVGCLECHSIHNARVPRHLLKAESSRLCSTCHAQKQ